jgi:ligand-binding sensor domain-containing protein/signal transduction histidine kinase
MSFFGRICPVRYRVAVLMVWLGFLQITILPAEEIREALTGNPVVAQNSDGRLEVFRVDAEGELYHKWQKEAGGDWSPWVSLGGWLMQDISVARESDGRLVVFAVDKMSRVLRYKRRLDPIHPEGDWPTWSTLGKEEMVRAPVAVGQNLDGRLELFAVDAENGSLRRIWETSASGDWSEWDNFGGRVDPGFVVGLNQDGQLEIFGTDPSTHECLHRYQQTPNGTTNWSSWSSMKGNFFPRLAVAQNQNGDLEIFGVNRSSGVMQYMYQWITNSQIAWSRWSSLGGYFKAGIAVGQHGNGGLELFGVNETNTSLFRCYQSNPADPASWTAWEDIGGTVRPCPAIGRNADGSLEVFANDSEHASLLNYRREISNNSGWLDWVNMDQPNYQYAARVWQIDEGLPHNEVQAIAQTTDGYLWVGTRGGLARFDGINYTRFDSKNTPEIKNDSISALCVDREGALWIGTGGGGVVRLKEGGFVRYSRTNGLAGDTVTALCEANDGSMWIGTTEGMSRYKNGEFSSYTQNEHLLSNLIRAICTDQENNIWVATDEGLNRWNNGVKDSFTTASGLPHNSVRGIYADRGGKLWIGTDGGMSFYSEGKFYSYDTLAGLADRVVSAIYGDRRGNLWVGTFGGLNRFQEGRFLNELNSEGLPYDKINDFFEDREGNLWVGSNEGLIRFTPKRFFAYTKRQGLSHNNVVSVLEDRARNVWVGTWGGGLNKLRGEVITPFHFPNDYVLSLCEAYDGVWIGSDFDRGLAKYKNGEFTYYTWKDGLIKAGLKVLHEDRFLNLWIGTSKGLNCFRNGKFTTYTTQDGLAGNDVRAICEDAQGKLWFGTDGGLSLWRNGSFVNFTTKDGLPDNSVTALYGDNERNLWIGTTSGGLCRNFGGRFTTYNAKHGLFSDEIFEIVEDDYGWMWMSCSKGIFRVRKKDFDAFDQHSRDSIVSIAYGKADGMESAQCNGAAKPGAWKSRDGRLWFPTTKGLVAVNPKIEIQDTPPPVFIEEVIGDGKSIMAGGLGTERHFSAFQSHNGNLANGTIQIPPGRGELEFHYTALNFQTPEKSRFKYKLDKVDRQWVEAGNRRTVHYNNIHPGHYTFQVIACNSDGVWNEKGASLAIVVLPHFWQTPWFYAVIALVAVGGVYSAARYMTKVRMQRNLELLKQQNAIERERGRIAKDIHDDLGSNLTRIMMLGERAHDDLNNPQELDTHVKKIVDCARDTVQTLDEIVWAVNPENDTLDGLVTYINLYISQFFESTSIICRLEMPIEISGIRLDAEIRHDLFLMVKEALNNILKHSGATEVRVRISEDGASVKIVIEDNGRGFAETNNNSVRKGHGMENMRRRSENFGGEILVASVPAQGTRLTITVPLPGRDERN